ncbi:MAG: hypothetical protein K1X94_14505 [Sandaracinaceae bacterium]|nr:hypothetical protein [Sandaracinaceae bacterium]
MPTYERATLVLTRAGALAATCSLAGCIVYDPKLVERDAGPSTIDSAVDAASNFDAGPVASHQPPTRPGTPDDGVDVGEVSFGLRMVSLDQGDGWRDIGYDLDRRFTQAPTYDTECRPPGIPRPPGDGTDGIDNVFGASLYPLVEITVPGLEDTARAAQEEGFGLPVIRIAGWNGTPNDSRIRTVITTSVFTTSADGVDDMTPPVVDIRGPRDVLIGGAPAPLPAWDQHDWTWVRSDSYVGGDLSRPIISDDNAYVSDGVMVTRLPSGVDILFPAMDTGVLVRLTDAIATGVIAADGNLSTITVAGRWSIVDLLSTAENVGICRGSTEYNILEGQLNRIADVRREPWQPGDPTDLDCDALSLGVTFVGTRFRVAGLTEGADVVSQCLTDAGVTADAGSSGSSDAGVDAR